MSRNRLPVFSSFVLIIGIWMIMILQTPAVNQALSITETSTITATLTPTAFITNTPTSTLTPTESPTLTLTDTPAPTATATLTVTPLPLTPPHYSILILGDSIVRGGNATDFQGWAEQIQTNYPQYTITVSGIGGNTIRHILDRLHDFDLAAYTHVILAIGTNDSRYRPSLYQHEVSLIDFKASLREFVGKFNLDSQTLYLVGLTHVDESKTAPAKPDKYFYNAYVVLYDQVIRDVAEESGIVYVTVPLLNDVHGLLDDGLHPNDDGHAVLYETIVAQLPFLNP